MSPAFLSPEIIAGLVYEQTTVKPMVVQKLDDENTLLVFAEGENIEKVFQKLWSIEIWLGQCMYWITDDAGRLWQARREENMVGEGTSMQLSRLTSEPQHENFCPSVTSR